MKEEREDKEDAIRATAQSGGGAKGKTVKICSTATVSHVAVSPTDKVVFTTSYNQRAKNRRFRRKNIS